MPISGIGFFIANNPVILSLQLFSYVSFKLRKFLAKYDLVIDVMSKGCC